MAGLIASMIYDPTTVAIFLGVLLLVWIIYPRKKYNLPPGPNWPIIGAIIEFMTSKHGNKIYMQFFDWGQKYGSVVLVKTPMLFGDMVVINEIKEVMEALVTKSTETGGRLSSYTVDILTDGTKDIAFADYSARVKYQRRIASAALRNLFSGGRLETMTHSSIEKGIQILKEKAESKEAFDPTPILNLEVYNIICAMCFDTNYELDDTEFQTIYRANADVSDMFSSGLFLVDYFPPARYFPRTSAHKKLLVILDVIDSYLLKQVQQHKEKFDPENVKDFLDHMLKLEQEAESDEDKAILDETHYKQTVADIFGAGTDTTSRTLVYIVLLLSEFPEVQDKVQEEIDRVIGSSRLPSISDKAKMPYCEAVMFECMRFGTIAPLGVPHKAVCDTTIGGYDIPKDTTVMINHHALHRDPKEWKNPEEFDPSHFLDDDGQLRPKPRSFLPFGAGKRVCLGEGVAKPEIFMVYTAMFQHFRFKLEEGHKRDLSFDDMAFAIQPKPFKVKVESRR